MIPVVCWKADMLSEVEGREKRQELRSKVISRIVKVNIEVTGYYKFMRSGWTSTVFLASHNRSGCVR